MTIAIRGGANPSRDYVDTYAMESQRAAKPRIGSGSTSAVRGVAITACKSAISQRRSCDAQAHEPHLCARVEKGRGRGNKMLFEHSRRFSLALRHKPRAKPWAEAINGRLACTQNGRTWTSTAAL
ncbi:hypothetical protein [Bradyrhizobium sp. GM2.2]|uniref:hypothetical protein n=1 Tax=Bradyrhizobium sp. GM2.2 TaxID=3156358 RepID=UPI003395F277